MNPMPAQMYVKDITQLLMREQRQMVTYDRFGWDEGRFIVGKTAFLPNGNTEEVLVSENVMNTARNVSCVPKGDLATWIDLMDKAYNRPDAEMYQFVIAAYGFASPLVPLMDFKNYRGVPVVLSGEGSIGKSSVFKAANTIYADPNVLLVDASAKNGATLQGLLGMASMFNGLPVLFDELTEREDNEFTPMMYSISNGVGKIRMTSGGKFAETVSPFAGIPGGTSNVSITDKIYNEEKKNVSDASSARCFEIGGLTLADRDAVFAGTDMKSLLEHELFEHHGVAAQVYLPSVIKNRESIRKSIINLRTQLGNRADVNSRERFYIDTIAFAHVAATIAHRLGLIKWDVKAMTKWAIDHLKNLRRDFSERTALSEDNLNLFLGWIHGNVIMTKHMPSGKLKDLENPMEPIKKYPMGRIAVLDRKFFVPMHVMREWCKEHDQVYEQIRDKFKRDGYIIAERNEYLGKGTNVHVGRARCFEFDYDKIVGALHALPSTSEVGSPQFKTPPLSQGVSQ